MTTLAKKSSDEKAIRLITSMRKMRREANLTQQKVADDLGLCRETVVAIEKFKKGSVENLNLSTVKGWWALCREEASPETSEEFSQSLTALLDI